MKITKYLLLIPFLFCSGLQAETVYVDDTQNIIWVRTGPTKEYRTPFKIAPHSVLELIQVNEETSFSQVRDVTGREFWIESENLTKEPTSIYQLETARKRITEMESQYTAQIDKLNKRVNELSPMEEKNKELQRKLAVIESDLEQTSQKAQLYESGFNREAYFTGSVIVLTGMFLGWLLSKLGGRKRNSGWN